MPHGAQDKRAAACWASDTCVSGVPTIDGVNADARALPV